MHHIDLTTITLAKGSHDRRNDGTCLMEAVAWWAEEPHSDQPACVSKVLCTFGVQLNDVLPDDRRQELRPLIPRLAGTTDDGLDETRSYMALDWLIRTWTPTWLDLAGLTAEATALRDLRRIADMAAAQAAGPVVRDARDRAAAAWDAAGAAAGDAAGAAAWDAAGAAARAAAGDAAWAADGAAAWAAAWDAAWAAAWAADGAAAWAALQPTVDQLQESAIGLFTAMIRPAVAS